MSFKIGDRVITNQAAFEGNTSDEAAQWRGVKGTIVERSLAFDWGVEVDLPVEGVGVTLWHLHDHEIDLLGG
jgi:hypothetical protein